MESNDFIWDLRHLQKSFKEMSFSHSTRDERGGPIGVGLVGGNHPEKN